MSASSGSDAVMVEQERLDESAAMANEFGHGMTSLAVARCPGPRGSPPGGAGTRRE
jgi:hypothetical protein